MTAPGGTERTLLSRALLLTAGVGLVCVAVASVARGLDGFRGALVGIGLVLTFLVIGQVPISQVARGRRRLGAALLVVLYVGRVLLLVLAYGLVLGTGAADALDREALGLAVVAGALAWTAGTVWSALRWRPVLVVPESEERARARR